jgi:hypothetical protein
MELELQMRRLIPYLITSLLALTTDLVVNAMSNSVTIPRRFDLLLPLVYAFLIIVTAIIDFRENRDPSGRGSSQKRTADRPPPDSELLIGRKRRKAESSSLEGIWYRGWMYLASVIGSPVLIAYGIGISLGKAYARYPNPGEGVPMIVIGLIMIIWLVAYIRKYQVGKRTRIWISSDGVIIDDLDGRLAVSWKDVKDFYTTSSVIGGTWLLASVRHDSPLIFRGETSERYDPTQGSIKLCNLRAAGIKGHRVDAALKYRHP